MSVHFAGGAATECVIDTGFDGALMLPRALVTRLQLPIVGRLVFQTVGGVRASADVALAEIEWLAQARTFEVLVSAHDDSLIGTELLDGTQLTIDYAALTVTISK